MFSTINNKANERQQVRREAREAIIKQELDAVSSDEALAVCHAIIGLKRDCICISSLLPKELQTICYRVLRSVHTQQDMFYLIKYTNSRLGYEKAQLSPKGVEFRKELARIAQGV